MVGWILIGLIALEIIFSLVLRRIEHKKNINKTKGVKEDVS